MQNDIGGNQSETDLFRVPAFNSAVDSAQATLPAGYSGNIDLVSSRTEPEAQDFALTSSNTDTYKEPPRRQETEHGHDISLDSVTSCSKSSEHEEDDRGDHERPFPRVPVGCVAKDELSEHGSGEGDRGDIALRCRFGVASAVQDGQDCRYGTDNADGRNTSDWLGGGFVRHT